MKYRVNKQTTRYEFFAERDVRQPKISYLSLCMGSVKLLKASAGSGKTFKLAYEYVRNVVEAPHRYRHILAVTFTKKATEEMKRRIIAEINDLARGRATKYMELLRADLGLADAEIARRAVAARSAILHDYSRFSVLTIDKFFQQLIRSFMRELDVDFDFVLELKTGTLLAAAADRLIDDAADDPALRAWIAGFAAEKIEENRHWNLRGELTRLGGEVFGEQWRRVSEAGGRVSREMLASLVDALTAEARTVMARLQATGREAMAIIGDNGLSISDFAYGKLGFANFFARYSGGEVAEPGARVGEALTSDEKWCAKSSPRRADILSLVPVLRPLLQTLVDGWEQHHRFLNSVEVLRANYRNFALLADLSRRIEAIYAEEGRLTIAETNDMLRRLVEGNDAPFIFERAGNRFTHFMIDEFQDTSAVQWANFVPLLQNAVSQTPDSPVLLVGDVKQSIYRWRGGDWRILSDGIGREFCEVDEGSLDTNWRSLGNVVAFNNAMTQACVETDGARLDEQLEEACEQNLIGRELRDELRGMMRAAYAGHAQTAAKGAEEGYVSVTVYEEDDEAVSPVIARIEELQQRGFRAGDIAVLVRTGAEGMRIANMLLDRKKANPDAPYSYDVVTQEALLINASPAVDYVLACFRLAASPDLDLAHAVYNRYQGREFEAKIPTTEREFLSGLRFMSPQEAFEAVVMQFGLGERTEDVAYLQALHDRLLSFSADSVADVALFVKWWDENGAALSVEIPQSADAITVTTIHKAKGLEYPAVVLPYCNWSLRPRIRSIVWADGRALDDGLAKIPAEFGERMRLSRFAEDYYRELVMSHVDNMNIFYVAVTRAGQELHLMMPAAAKPREDRIDTLILGALETGLCGIQARTTDAGEKIYEFGEKVFHAEKAATADERLHVGFGSYPIGGRLHLRTGSERYFTDEGGTLAPRDYGILMHRAFEAARTAGDIDAAIARMESSALITSEEARLLHERIVRAMADPHVREWFDGEWDTVRNESDIVVPSAGGGGMRRPDRVMTRGTRAVIVDYKFGLERSPRHAAQIRDYAALLGRMGYAEVEGYVWYVSLDDIEEILLN